MTMSDLYFAVYGAIMFVPLFLGWRSVRKTSGQGPLPPGPSLLPFVGNAFDIDVSKPWLTYAGWKDKYGDIIYSRVLGQHIIIISSLEVARDLLDKRSAIYSDRPQLRTNEELGIGFNTAFLPYGDTLRLHRKLYHHDLNAEASADYHDLYLRKASQLVINLLQSTPHETEKYLETYSGSLIMAATYGYEAQPEGDPIISCADEVIKIGTKLLAPERAILLATFPFLEYLPSWFPGAADRRLADYCRKLVRRILDEPFEIAKEQFIGGERASSIVGKFLSEDGNRSPAQEEFMKGVAISAFTAGTETTASTLYTFVLAMLLHPDVQSRAVAEIDAICGDDIPNFGHRPSLPYIEAICREVLRWHPVSPLGLPHMASKDDIYEGYFIPKGSTIMVNAWALSQDDRIYPEASRFIPERHLTAEGKLKDNPVFCWGFGRRICPGRHFAELSLWAAMVSILSTMRIVKAKDSEGMDIPVIPEFTTGLTSKPRPFAFALAHINSRREGLMRAASRMK